MRLRAAAAAALLTATAAGALCLPAAAQPGPALPVSVQLTRIEPKAPQPHQTLRVAGTVLNTGPTELHQLTVHLDVGGKITTRSDLAAWSVDPTGYIGRGVAASEVPVVADLPPGGSAPFHLALAVDDVFGSPDPVIYQIGVEVDGVGPAGYRQTLGRLRTLLPWAPPGSVRAPTRIAWVWPLIDRPHRATNNTFLDDDLAAELAAGGRLRRLLDAGAAAAGGTPAVPVGWAVDPLLVQDAALMAAGYRSGNTAHPPTSAPAQAAAAWLHTLRAALAGAAPLNVPYADVDIDALVAHQLRSDVADAMFSGAAVMHGLVSRTLPLAGIWPPGSYLTPEALSTLAAANVSWVLLRDDALPLQHQISFTPTAHTTLPLPGGFLDALLTDGTIDDVVDAGAAQPASGRLEEQRFLAETLLVTQQLPSLQRDLVVAPDRRWSPQPHYAEALLADSANVPWLQPVSVQAVLADPPSTLPRSGLQYPSRAATAGLSGPYLREVAALRSSTALVESVVVDTTTTLARELYLAGFRAESSALRSDPGLARRIRVGLAGALASVRSKIGVASGGLVTLTSNSGAVPITLANRLPQQVRITLHLDAGAQAKIQDGGNLPETLAPDQLTQVQVHMRAQVNGVFRVRVALYSPGPNPRRLGPTTTLLVRSTGYGVLALGITGGAFAVLLVAVAVRLTRRALRARRAR